MYFSGLLQLNKMEIIIAWIDNDKLWKLFYMSKTDSYTEWIYHLYYAMVEKKWLFCLLKYSRTLKIQIISHATNLIVWINESLE